MFATLAGIAVAGGSLRTDGSSTSTTTTYTTASSALGTSGSYPAADINGLNLLLGGGSSFGTSYGSGFGLGSGFGASGAGGLAVSSAGGLGATYTGLSSGTGLGNIGTGAVLVTAGNGGASGIVSGGVITDGNFPRADLNVLSGSSSSLVNNNVIANGVINNAYANTISPSRSIDSLFARLPSSAELDNLILSADSVAVLKTIQAVGTNESLPCDQRIAYLLELLGRLKAAVAKKSFAGEQVKIVIDAAVKEAARLQALVDANNAAIAKLGVDGLKTRLTGLLADLQNAYVAYNKVTAQIPVIEAQINGNDQEIQILVKNSDAERNRIANDKLKLADIVAQINSIQARLNDLVGKQTSIQTAITRGETNIANNDKAIVEINNRIDDLQGQIRTLTDQADQFNGTTKDLEVKVGRLRTDISVNEAKKAKLLRDNDDLNARIALERKKNIPDQLIALNDMVANLKNLVPTVESEIDRHYYYCYGEGKVQVQQTGGVVVYIVRGEAFGNYLRNLYGRSMTVPAVTGDVLLNRVDIFGQSWVGAFGYPFTTAAFGDANGSDLALNGSFGCLNPSSVVSGSGTITAIGSNWIDANVGGQTQRFGLGSCSRLESTTKLPSVGQKFFWSGVPGGSMTNLYTGDRKSVV